jgi:hypothetical protein
MHVFVIREQPRAMAPHEHQLDAKRMRENKKMTYWRNGFGYSVGDLAGAAGDHATEMRKLGGQHILHTATHNVPDPNIFCMSIYCAHMFQTSSWSSGVKWSHRQRPRSQHNEAKGQEPHQNNGKFHVHLELRQISRNMNVVRASLHEFGLVPDPSEQGPATDRRTACATYNASHAQALCRENRSVKYREPAELNCHVSGRARRFVWATFTVSQRVATRYASAVITPDPVLGVVQYGGIAASRIRFHVAAQFRF